MTDPTTLPLLRRRDLDTAADGLYQLAGDRYRGRGDLYDVAADEFLRDVEWLTLARVRPGGRDLPAGVEEAYTRADGSQVILQRTPVTGWSADPLPR